MVSQYAVSLFFSNSLQPITYLAPKKLEKVSFMYNPEAKHRGHVLSSYVLSLY